MKLFTVKAYIANHGDREIEYYVMLATNALAARETVEGMFSGYTLVSTPDDTFVGDNVCVVVSNGANDPMFPNFVVAVSESRDTE